LTQEPAAARLRPALAELLARVVGSLVDLDGATVGVFGHNAAGPGHLFVSGQDRGAGLVQRRDHMLQGIHIQAREDVAARAAFRGAAGRLGWVDREVDRAQFGGEMGRALAVVFVFSTRPKAR